MSLSWVALVSFVLVTTFTPGPNNVSSMALGMSHGFRGSLRFLFGIAAGFVVVMALCALVSVLLATWLPAIEPYLRIVGSLYIVWLAVHTFLGSLRAEPATARRLGFMDGFLLQALNAKVIIYGLTLYSTFLAPISADPLLGGLSAVALAAVGLVAVSVWNVAGAFFSRQFQKPVLRRIVAAVLSLFLVYSALESSGLLGWLSSRV